ncbi:MAG: FxSxx-COOH system tetratricopeptide repeat protein [Janthinobacterium lividum]
MPLVHLNLFLSAVTNEFRSYRANLQKTLTRPNVAVKIQEEFIAGAGTTLEKLNEYVQHCDAVIHLVGDLTGAVTTSPSLDWLRARYPDLSQRYPALQELLDENSTVKASYTQWEAYLAIYHGRALLVAAPTPEALRDENLMPEPVAGSVQSSASHLTRLKQLGFYPEIKFTNVDRLAADVALSKLYDLLLMAGIQAAELPNTQPLQPQNLPYPALGSLFKGRAPFVRALRAEFASATVGRKALHGLGGIGKTRLAIEYAWLHRHYYAALLFVRADTSAELEANLAALCGAQTLNLPEQIAAEQEIRLRAVIDWLARHPGWLLIVDNVDTKDAALAVERWLPKFGNGHVLITGRISRWSQYVERLELDVLRVEDAVEFLLERTQSERETTPNDAAEALALASELGQLALALEQAGAYIEERSITLAAYRQRWASNDQAVRTWFDEQLMGYPRSVATTWLTSFQELSFESQTLLNRLAWLAAEPVPRSLLFVPIPDVPTLDPEIPLVDLIRFSLATLTVNKRAFSIHRLVQEVSRARLEGEARQQVFMEALMWMGNAFIGDPYDVHTWPLLESLRPHALDVAVKHAPEFGNPEPTVRLINQLGQLMNEKAQYSEAEPLLRLNAAIDEAHFGPSHPHVSTSLINLALLLHTTNRSGEAEEMMRKALSIDEAHFGPNHPEVASCLSNLGGLLDDVERSSEAEPLLRRALRIDTAHFGFNHPTIAVRMNNLGGALANMNQVNEAEKYYRQALQIDEAHLGLNHPYVAIRLNNLAHLLHNAGQLSEAEPLYRRAVAINEAAFGPEHPQVSNSLSNLASLLQNTNRAQEAEPIMRRVLQNDEKTFGLIHPKVAIRLNNLAGLLEATNRLQEAEPLYLRALAIDEASSGPDHPTVAMRLHNLGGLLSLTNRLQEAKDFSHRSVSIFAAFYRINGYHHPGFQKAFKRYTSILGEIGHSNAYVKNMLDSLSIHA